jgi:hypothetical protein
MQIRRIALPDTLTQQMTRGDESPRRYDELKLKLRLFGKFHRRGQQPNRSWQSVHQVTVYFGSITMVNGMRACAA